MDKQKRKGHPYNSKQYWIIFSVLVVGLLIPFRIVEFWMLTNIIYISISIVIGIALVRFIRHYTWKRWIVALMLLGILLPVLQVYHNRAWINCTYNINEGILQTVSCSEGCDTDSHMLAIADTGIAVQIYFGRYFPYCLY